MEVRPVNVEAPVTDNVPSVLIFVLMVVAASTTPTTSSTDRTTDTTIEIGLCFLSIKEVTLDMSTY